MPISGGKVPGGGTAQHGILRLLLTSQFWWCSRPLSPNSLYQPMSTAAGVRPLVAGFVRFAL